MSPSSSDSPRAAILHRGPHRPAFGKLPERLARLTGWPIREEDAGLDLAYVLAWDGEPPRCRTFVPWDAIQLAHDKRAQARAFQSAGVPTPETHLLPDAAAVRELAARRGDRRWVLKWPLGCGGVGHRLLTPETPITRVWPAPHLVQELVELERPEVYRLFCAGGETFGWCARRFPPGRETSPWVSAARGAVFQLAGPPPPGAERAGAAALRAAGLLHSFGCADLLPTPDGRWLVLEVNTDGVHEWILRETGIPELTEALDTRLLSALRTAMAAEPGR